MSEQLKSRMLGAFILGCVIGFYIPGWHGAIAGFFVMFGLLLLTSENRD